MDFTAKLFRDGKLAEPSVKVLLEVKAPVGRLSSWWGKCSLSSDSSITLAGVQTSKFHLELDDGRRGEFLIRREHIESDSQLKQIEFIGTGPLAAQVSSDQRKS